MNKTTLGKIIRTRRIELKISQRDLANRLVGTRNKYCSPQVMNNIERDVRTGKQYWQSLSKELGIPIDVFTYYGLLAKSGLDPSRSDERRVGKECSSKCRSRGSP